MPPPALLLHGVPTAGRLWDGVRAALADVDSLAPDLPGYGAAPAPATFDLDATVDFVVEHVRARGASLAELHVVGHDYGGLVAAALAAREPLRSLTLTSTALGWGWLPAKLGAYPPADRWFYRRHEGALWLDRGVAPAHRAALHAAFPRRPGLGREMAALARSFDLAAQHRLPARWQCPAQLVWGTADTSIRPAYARWLARRTGAPLRWLPGLRHYAMWEDPAAFAAALREGWAATDARR